MQDPRPGGLIPYVAVASWRRALHVGAFLLLGAYVCWAAAPLTRPITIDNQIYIYAAEQVADGVPPHISLVDHKHALSSILSGAAIAAGRLVHVNDVFGARAVSLAFAVLLAPALWIIAYRLTGNAVIAHLSAATMLTFGDYFSQAAMGVRPQVFMTSFLVLTFAAFAHERWALSGVLAISAFLCWQPALLVFGSLGLALLLAGKVRGPLVRLVVAGAATFLVYEAYFVYHGALREQLYQSFVMAGNVERHTMPPIGESLHFVLRGGSWGARWWILVPALYLAFLVAIVAEVYARPRETFVFARQTPLATALALTAILTLAFTFFDHQAYPDRYFIQPFVALANGIVIGWALCFATRRLIVSDAAKLRFSGVVFIVALAAAAATVVPVALRRGSPLEVQRVAARRAERIGQRYGSLWAIGCLHLLALERQANYDPIGLVIDPRVRAYASARGVNGVYRPQGGKMPAVILAARWGLRQAFPWLPSEYRKVPDAALNREGAIVWVRKDCLADRPCTNALACPVTEGCSGKADKSAKSS